MFTITKISLQKRIKDRYNIYLDGKYSFPVSEKVLLTFGLKVDQKIEQSLIDEVLFGESYEKIYNKVLNFLSYRIRSKSEVIARLKEYFYKDGISEEIGKDFSKKIITTLEKVGLLNDLNFVKVYVENSKSLKTPPGQQKIRLFLYKKGIARELIEKVVSESYSSADEERGATLLLEKKVRSIKGEVDYKKKQKLISFLVRKGYSFDVVKRVVDSKFEV